MSSGQLPPLAITTPRSKEDAAASSSPQGGSLPAIDPLDHSSVVSSLEPRDYEDGGGCVPASSAERKKFRDRQAKEKQRASSMLKKRQMSALSAQLNMQKDHINAERSAAAALQYQSLGLPIPPSVLALGAASGTLDDDGTAATVADGTTNDLFSNFSVEQSSVGAEASATTKHTAPDIADLVDLPPPGYECFICKVRQAGCPLCWEFPEWKKKVRSRAPTPAAGKRRAEPLAQIEQPVPKLAPRDYAFAPGQTEDPGEEVDLGSVVRPPLHTCLTTHTGIQLYRRCFLTFYTFNIKTVPAGDVVAVSLDAETSTVWQLYEKFRANAAVRSFL